MVDIPGDTSTTSVVTVGSTTNGTLEVVGDHDWYKIVLTAGQSITVTINGVTLEDPYVYIRNAAGNVIAENDDINPGIVRDSKVSFTATTSGVYYIDVGAFDADVGGPGDYAGTFQVVVSTYTPPPLVSTDTIAGQLINGYWGGPSEAHHFNVAPGGTIDVNLTQISAAGQTLARAALQLWSDVIGVTFREVTSGGQILFGEDTDGAFTDGSWSNGIIDFSHVNIGLDWLSSYGAGPNNDQLGSYAFQSYVHEIGHALGLGHAGNYNGTADYFSDALFRNDSWSTSIMSYFSPHDNTYFSTQGFSEDFSVTPMIADIAAMQQMYGLSTTTRTGDTIYGYNSNADRSIFHANLYPDVALTIVDSGGTDTIDYSGFGGNQVINLNSETFSNVNGSIGNLSIGRGTVIENAKTGGGADSLIGNDVANLLQSGGGVDTLIGNGGNDTLTGGAGADTLTGGTGSDLFKDTKAGLNGDTLVDFGTGDAIVLTDATLAGFSFNLSGHTLTFSGGSLTLTNIPAGTITASAAAGGGVQLTVTPSHDPDNDFNGDGRSDILWRHDNGQFGDWLADANGNFIGNATLVGVSADWKIVGAGDFNGDGKDDILWRHDSGTIGDWLGDANGNFSPNGALAASPLSWHVAGTGDFNGDGKDDILWRSDAGEVGDWLAQPGGSFAPNPTVVGVTADWKIVGTGDFDNDGKDDILWRNDSGTIGTWLGQSDGNFIASAALAASPLSWHVVGTGDFNGDGKDDILWRSDAGEVGTWLAQANGSFAPNPTVVNIPLAWHVAAVGDYNGDSRDDILWRHDNGTVGNWFADANGNFTSNPTAVGVSTDWHIQPQHPDWLF